ncbi:MAG: hypothetical protein EB059_08025 [Alphaproteobacteria bacterium]|nr:hypothetical protein [Alphaproteobacteria bacterium]
MSESQSKKTKSKSEVALSKSNITQPYATGNSLIFSPSGDTHHLEGTFHLAKENFSNRPLQIAGVGQEDVRFVRAAMFLAGIPDEQVTILGPYGSDCRRANLGLRQNGPARPQYSNGAIHLAPEYPKRGLVASVLHFMNG